MLTRVTPEVVRDDLPLRHCVDCQHNLGDPLRALAAPCPMWGKDRSTAAVRCLVFEPLASVRVRP